MDLEPPPIPSPSEGDTRSVLQASWDTATRGCGAARVTIVNELDDEPIPPSIGSSTFQYSEVDYHGYVDGSYSSLSVDCEPQTARNRTLRHWSDVLVKAHVQTHLTVIAKKQPTPLILDERGVQLSLRTKM